MSIKLSITLSSGGRFKPVASRTLRDAHITIGRDNDCTLTLEDAHKHVSRVHAELDEEAGTHWLTVVSKVNPVLVNGKRYMLGDKVALAEGDTIAIGLYRLEVLAPEVPAPAAADLPEDVTYVRPSRPPEPPAPVLPAAPPEPPPQPEATPVELDLVLEEEATFVPPPKVAEPPSPPEPPADEEEATFVPRAVPPPPAPPGDPGAGEEITYVPPVPTEAPPKALSDNPVLRRLAELRQRSGSAAPDSTAPDAAPAVAQQAEAGAELDFDLSEEETFVPRPVEAAPPAPPPDTSEESTYVPRVAPAPPPMPPAPPAAQEEEPFNDEATMIRRPGPLTEPPPPPPPPPSVAQPLSHAAAPAAARPGGDALLQAFLQGAGLSRLDVPDPEAFMRDSGALARTAVESVMMLLAAREEMRRELGAGAAAPEDSDNPLKSLSSPAEAVAFLFDPKRPAVGAADPARTFGEACTDLRVHQLALMAGMRAAVEAALASLDPKKIEREHGTSLGGLNLTRKSKLWDISVAQYEKLGRGIEEDFNNAFGRDILAAYDAQVRKLRGEG